MLPMPVGQAAASTIAGTPVKIVCEDFARVAVPAAIGADGTVFEFVLPDPAGGYVPTIHLPQSTCSTLRRLDRERPGTTASARRSNPAAS
jgi:hypothetical protein